jgi:hypothetical protein
LRNRALYRRPTTQRKWFRPVSSTRSRYTFLRPKSLTVCSCLSLIGLNCCSSGVVNWWSGCA